MAQLTDADKMDVSVSHALQVRQAVSQGHYTKLFRLFNAAPKMGAYLMDHFVARERVAAMVTMTKAYMVLPCSMITQQLAFNDLLETIAFLAEYKADKYKPAPAGQRGVGEDPQLDCKLAQKSFVDALASMSKVDLKGQI